MTAVSYTHLDVYKRQVVLHTYAETDQTYSRFPGGGHRRVLLSLIHILSLRGDRVVIPEDMVYPCFCKPMESITGYKHEMAKCEDEAELRSHLNRLRRIFADRSVLVQEFLEIDNEIDIGGVCLDQEIIIPAIIKKTNVAQYEKGVTLAGKVYPVEELGQLQETIVAMLREFHYFGMFDMELNIVGDKIYFNEVNLRSGGPDVYKRQV